MPTHAYYKWVTDIRRSPDEPPTPMTRSRWPVPIGRRHPWELLGLAGGSTALGIGRKSYVGVGGNLLVKEGFEPSSQRWLLRRTATGRPGRVEVRCARRRQCLRTYRCRTSHFPLDLRLTIFPRSFSPGMFTCQSVKYVAVVSISSPFFLWERMDSSHLKKDVMLFPALRSNDVNMNIVEQHELSH